MTHMKGTIINVLARLGLEVRRRRPDDIEQAFIRIRPSNGAVNGNVLLSYRVEWFLKEGDPLTLNSHTNYWESMQIAQTFLDLGYGVDVIDFRNREFVPAIPYDVFVGARTNFDRLTGLLSRDCLKIVHLDTAHWIFNNHATFERAMNVQKRKGMTVTGESQRIIEANLAIENADYGTLLGNDFTLSTYAYAGKPIFPVPIATCCPYDAPDEKSVEASRKNFLWFGSGGLVHKGLDLVLDAFAEMPEYHLYVCGPVREEKRFAEVYRRELFETPNIHAVGWVDADSRTFRDLVKQCVALVYPSCAEGQSGAVVTCLRAGLIPIISRQSGVDVGSFGVSLSDCSVHAIQETVSAVAAQPADMLGRRAREAWEYARMNHSRERFAEEYRRTIDTILTRRRSEQP